MPGTYALAGSESAGRTGGAKPHRAFPGICTLTNGNLLRTYRRGSSHAASDADLCAEISTDNGATWGSEQVIRASSAGFAGGSPAGTASNQEGCPVVLQHGANAGKVLVTGHQNNGWGYGSGATWKAVAYLSTDETATAWTGPYVIDNGFYANGVDYAYCSNAAVELPDGTLLLALAGYEQSINANVNVQTQWSARLSKSLDGGLTWTNHALVAASDLGANTVGYSHDEPYLIRLLDGTLLLSIRQVQTVGAQTECHIWRGSADGLTWTHQGKAFSDMGSAGSASRAGMIQDPATGAVLIQHRINLPSSGQSVQGAWRWSLNNGVTWVAGLDLHSGAAASYTASTGAVYDYGAFTILDSGDVGMLWAEESDPNARLYFRTVAASGFPPPASLTLDADAEWSQADTDLTVTAPIGSRTTVSGSVYAATGGTLRFVGTHADRFEASLDGSTWASTITIPPGITTVYLGVTPQTGDTALSASVGVPR